MDIAIEKQLQDFLDSPLRVRWLYTKEFEVYVRKGRHAGPDGKMHTYLDIANIEVYPEFQRQGRFKDFLALCQRISLYDGLFLENILNENVFDYLRRLASSDLRWHEKGMNFLWQKEL